MEQRQLHAESGRRRFEEHRRNNSSVHKIQNFACNSSPSSLKLGATIIQQPDVKLNDGVACLCELGQGWLNKFEQVVY